MLVLDLRQHFGDFLTQMSSLGDKERQDVDVQVLISLPQGIHDLWQRWHHEFQESDPDFTIRVFRL